MTDYKLAFEAPSARAIFELILDQAIEAYVDWKTTPDTAEPLHTRRQGRVEGLEEALESILLFGEKSAHEIVKEEGERRLYEYRMEQKLQAHNRVFGHDDA